MATFKSWFTAGVEDAGVVLRGVLLLLVGLAVCKVGVEVVKTAWTWVLRTWGGA